MFRLRRFGICLVAGMLVLMNVFFHRSHEVLDLMQRIHLHIENIVGTWWYVSPTSEEDGYVDISIRNVGSYPVDVQLITFLGHGYGQEIYKILNHESEVKVIEGEFKRKVDKMGDVWFELKPMEILTLKWYTLQLPSKILACTPWGCNELISYGQDNPENPYSIKRIYIHFVKKKGIPEVSMDINLMANVYYDPLTDWDECLSGYERPVHREIYYQCVSTCPPGWLAQCPGPIPSSELTATAPMHFKILSLNAYYMWYNTNPDLKFYVPNKTIELVWSKRKWRLHGVKVVGTQPWPSPVESYYDSNYCFRIEVEMFPYVKVKDLVYLYLYVLVDDYLYVELQEILPSGDRDVLDHEDFLQHEREYLSDILLKAGEYILYFKYINYAERDYYGESLYPCSKSIFGCECNKVDMENDAVLGLYVEFIPAP